jgi:hypothetical protein
MHPDRSVGLVCETEALPKTVRNVAPADDTFFIILNKQYTIFSILSYATVTVYVV